MFNKSGKWVVKIVNDYSNKVLLILINKIFPFTHFREIFQSS